MFNRKVHWESIHDGKSSLEVSWYLKEPSSSLELIRNTQVSDGEPIIDVGGGTSLLVDFLIEEGHSNIAVLDISQKALAYTQKRLGDLAQSVEWFETDITGFEAPHHFSLWHDRAVFHFLAIESDRRRYLEVLENSLCPGGHLVIATFSIGGAVKCSGLPVIQYDAKKLAEELGEDYRLLEERNEVHLTPASKEQEFTYFRFIREPRR